MALKDFDVLDQSEATLATVLLNNNLATEEAIQNFIRLKMAIGVYGKPYLGRLLIHLNFITQKDLDAFVAETEAEHIKFVESICNEGFISTEQQTLLLEHHRQSGRDLISLISDLNIMTKENYSRIFNKRTNTLRLGEWLLMNKRVTQEQLDQALHARNITKLDDYLIFYNISPKQTVEKIMERIKSLGD